VIAKLKKKNNLRTFEKIISDQQINEIPITLYKSKSRSNTTPFCSRKNFDGIYLENFKTSKSLKNRLDNQIEYYCINQKQLYENQKYSYKAKESQTQKEKESYLFSNNICRKQNEEFPISINKNRTNSNKQHIFIKRKGIDNTFLENFNPSLRNQLDQLEYYRISQHTHPENKRNAYQNDLTRENLNMRNLEHDSIQI